MDLYRRARELPGALAGDGTVLTAAAIAGAGVTRDTLRWWVEQGRLVRTFQGVYVFGATQPDLLDRARAALVAAPRGTVLGHQTAAALQGFGVAESDRVHVVTGADALFPQRRGIRTHRAVLDPGDPVRSRGLPCTSPARTAIDLARALPADLALATLDCVLHNGVCGVRALAEELVRHHGLRGFRQAQALLARADGRAECKQETQLRQVLHGAGLLGFVPQWEVRDGSVRYVLDLADPDHLVAAEYDGISHDEGWRREEDRVRHNWLDGHGWRMRYYTATDLYRRPWKIVAELRAAVSSRDRGRVGVW